MGHFADHYPSHYYHFASIGGHQFQLRNFNYVSGQQSCASRPHRRQNRLRTNRQAFPVSGLDRFFEGLFDDFLTPLVKEGCAPANKNFSPLFNVEETAEKYIIKAEIPGIEQEDLELSIEENHLLVQGEKREDFEGEAEQRKFVGRRYGSFKRVIPLAEEVKADAIDASLKNGILRIELPKEQKQPKARKIAIK